MLAFPWRERKKEREREREREIYIRLLEDIEEDKSKVSEAETQKRIALKKTDRDG